MDSPQENQPSNPKPPRLLQDNVWIRILPEKERTAGGIYIPKTVSHAPTGVARAEVLAVGPGRYRSYKSRGAGTLAAHTVETGTLIQMAVKVGDVVVVDRLCGQDYAFDISVPRHNKGADWADDRGEFRIVREDEIHCVDDDATAELARERGAGEAA